MHNFDQVDLENKAIEAFSKTDAALSVLADKYSIVPDANTKEGYEQIKAGLKEVVSYRTSLEKKRKEIKQPYLDAGKLIDSEAKRITAQLLQLENPMKEAKQAVDDREKREKEALQAATRAKIDSMSSALSRAFGASSSEISALIDEVFSVDATEGFYDLTREAIDTRNDVLEKLNSMYSQAAELEKLRSQAAPTSSEQKSYSDEYRKGYIDALTKYSHSVDGVLYIGTGGITLEHAISEIDNNDDPTI